MNAKGFSYSIKIYTHVRGTERDVGTVFFFYNLLVLALWLYFQVMLSDDVGRADFAYNAGCAAHMGAGS